MAELPRASGSETETQIEEGGAQKRERRKIPGNLPYTGSPGVLKKVLDKIPDAEKPSVFNADFLGTVLGATGGSARPIPPILKTTGLLNQSGAPTDLYSQFQTQSGRANAALQALKNGFAEIFKRNQYAHRLDEKGLLDVIVAVTGLPRTDNVVRAVLSTFQVFQGYARDASEEPAPETQQRRPVTAEAVEQDDMEQPNISRTLGLTYNINVVLPETTNVEVYNAIFRSIRANLLQ